MARRAQEGGAMNASKQKGKCGERELRDKLREAGFSDARRGVQYHGGEDSPDVICPSLGTFHFESKRQERARPTDIDAWQAQAANDAGAAKIAVVAHRRNQRPWLVTLTLASFLHILRRTDLEKLSDDTAR